MQTKIFYPRVVEQLASEEIAITDGDSVLDSTVNLTSARPLVGIAHSSGRLNFAGSRSLVFRDFGIDFSTVSNIELVLRVDRLARIQDNIVQLYYQGQARGRNLALELAENLQVYGGSLAQWAAGDIDYTSPDFGVLIDLKPHSQYPSNNLVYFRSLELRIQGQ